MACVLGGLVYWTCITLNCPVELTAIITFLVVCACRLLAVRYHISLPILKSYEENK
jgi:uncharacterized membrane protein YeiH